MSRKMRNHEGSMVICMPAMRMSLRALRSLGSAVSVAIGDLRAQEHIPTAMGASSEALSRKMPRALTQLLPRPCRGLVAMSSATLVLHSTRNLPSYITLQPIAVLLLWEG